MKHVPFCLISSLVLAILLTTPAQAQQKLERAPKMLRHVVLFKFKDTATKEEVKVIEDAFRALPGKVKLIKDFEWGINSSPENLNQGLTHCFFVSFVSEKDRDNYLVDPDHKAFVEILKPHLDKVTVIDYWAGK